ncbi:insulinase family protein [Anaerotignum lactatifermentans]|uniref:Insulinase family protein n=1 Tax=Anaerotignum lactatifermentans TaxID=160404 RepID=A0ABS2G8B5_9FIRM|nr:insulinase family protein [Anaerotignum lactatifermentans]MBM6828424.1 insulinase family protein [Anaerotignum lactatifermentans]MBM6877704.1 insulinase family protein [Anaerotignum lactatifermentans]MBM6950007.1 insulinase family protein [Anaerotignum lactatifermentans]
MKKFELGKTYHGFLLEQTMPLEEIHAEGYLFTHIKSGARLCYLASKDNNKVFSITFKTPPRDDTGVAHILEHCVLCGSEKYGAKDPFNELAKGSLNTFLNAMTYPDKTMYPIASCNEKDFRNMMDVYLDAVFHPNIYHKKGIFLQEGWRLAEQEGKRTATGVVFNEMKGALSDPESRLAGAISRSIFGKTTYGFESGGEPSAIIDLTYTDFLNYHREWYHPSNAYLYLYGDMEIMRCLEHLDQAYLTHYEKSQQLPIIKDTKVPLKNEVIYETFPAENETDDKGYFAYNFKIGHCTDTRENLTMQILGYLLLETNASPLKNALRDAGICEEAEGYFDSSTYETVYSIIGKNGKKEDFEHFCNIVEEVLSHAAKNGFGKELLHSSLKKMEFLLREEDYGSRPKGLIYHTRQMKSWLHGENPLSCLKVLTTFLSLKEEIQKGYLSAFIQEKFLCNPEKTKLCFLPEWGKQEQEDAALRKKVEDRLSSMTEAQKSILKEDDNSLAEFQNAEDTPELLAQIPILQREDIDKKPMPVPRKETIVSGSKVLHISMESQGIFYGQILFPTEVPQEQLFYAGLLAEVLGKLDTKKTAFAELSAKTDRIFGGFSMSNDIYSRNNRDYLPFLTINFKILKEDLEEGFTFLKEILTETDYTNVESLLKIVKSAKLKGEMYFQNQAHSTAIFRSRAAVSAGAATKEQTSGISYYHFLCNTEKSLLENPSAVVAGLKAIAKKILVRDQVQGTVGCSKSDFAEYAHWFADLKKYLPEGNMERTTVHFQPKERKEGFRISSKVQYNIKTWDLAMGNIPYHGNMQVLKTIITLEYLWNQIRVQGGAYGCGCNFQRNGGVYFYSYRDPNLRKTYDVYGNLSDKIKDFQADEREMTKYIIGTINRFDQPKTNGELLDYGTALYFAGITEEMRQQERMEILNTSAAEIRQYEDLLKMIANSENICTIGGEEILNAQKDYFDSVENLIRK